MIISVNDVVNVYHIYDTDESKDLIQAKLDGLESLIRSYTNNNFQNRNIRIDNCPSINNCLYCTPTYFRVGDTVQITNSIVNDGLYVIEEITDMGIILNKDIYDCESNRITKVEYPNAIISTIVNILKWDKQYGEKMGIQSESIGRHSVSYFNQNADNSLGGYPKHLFNSLAPYIKASRRF